MEHASLQGLLLKVWPVFKKLYMVTFRTFEAQYFATIVHVLQFNQFKDDILFFKSFYHRIWNVNTQVYKNIDIKILFIMYILILYTLDLN